MKLPEMQTSIVLKYDSSTSGVPTWTILTTVDGFVYQMNFDRRVQLGLLGMFEVQQAIIDYDDFHTTYTATCNRKPLQATVGSTVYNVSGVQEMEQKFVTLTLVEVPQ